MMTPEDKRQLDMFCEVALTTQESVYKTFEIAETCIAENVDGCFVECGVFCGTQCAAMAWALMKHGQYRKVHLFDSFCGIPQAGPEDDVQPGIGRVPLGTGTGELKTTKVSSCSVPGVQQLMFQWGIDTNLLEYHRGWLQATVPFADLGPIAILRLDADLHDSTKVSIEYLYPWLSKGGFLIIDDWGLRGCRKAVTDYFEKIGRDLDFEFPEVRYPLAIHRNPERFIMRKPK